MPGRYALYYAPQRGSALERFGRSWLGRCAETGQAVDQPDLSDLSDMAGISPDRFRNLTAAPRHYGFHGTLVPPFEPLPGVSEEKLLEHAAQFAAYFEEKNKSVVLKPLAVTCIGSFLALVPDDQHGMATLAEAALRAFHPLRTPPSQAELDRRRAAGLSANQQRLLETWGYPYVLEEYRFHMTLSGSIDDDTERRALLSAARAMTTDLCRTERPVRELCIFHQPDRTAPFTLVQRVPLGA